MQNAVVLACFGLLGVLGMAWLTPEQAMRAEDERPPFEVSSTLRYRSMIRSLLVDRRGNLWVGSDQEGVCRYDGESFLYLTVADGLLSGQIRSIQEDQQGNVWFATGRGVNKFDGQQVTSPKAATPLFLGNVQEAHWEKQAGDLWFNGEVAGGIYRYDGRVLSILRFPVLPSDHESFSISGTVTGICRGQDNMLWMANYGGVLGYDGETFRYINQRGINYHVRSLLEDRNGTLWIGNNGIGVLRYDGVHTTNFSDQIGEEVAFAGDTATSANTLRHVFTLAEDAEGNVWFGDRDTGAWRYDGECIQRFTAEDGLGSSFVRVIYCDPKGTLWFGTTDGGVYQFREERFARMF